MKTIVRSFTSLALMTLSLTAFGQNQTATVDSLKKSLNSLTTDVEALKNLKIGGWIQAQYQWTETKGAKTFDGGDFLANSNNRFMIRRGRIKFTYTKGIGQYVLQVNATERGVNVVDFYAKVTDPWTKAFSLTAGIMNRPYGFEIQQSSQDRETPERARFTQVLLPNERDLGAMITFQPVKGKKLYGLKVDAGFYNGTGIAVPGTTSLNGAGGVVYQSNKVYSTLATDSMGVVSWQLSDTTNTTFKGGKAPRIYYGGDIQFSVKSKLGTTSIRGEYITGTQTGTIDENKSPSSLPTKPDAVVRNFNGGYAYLIQRIGKTKHELALKYEWYDPNTKVTGADLVGTNGMTKAELKYTMLGVGYNYYMTENVKFMVYYNMVTNENAKALTGDRKSTRLNSSH